MSIPFPMHGSIYQYKKINAGESAVVYEYKLPSDLVGFICELAINWFPSTYWGFEIDNNMVEQIERKIGTFKRPKVFDPPYFVESIIKFTAYNNDSKAHRFEVLCDGLLIKKIT